MVCKALALNIIALSIAGRSGSGSIVVSVVGVDGSCLAHIRMNLSDGGTDGGQRDMRTPDSRSGMSRMRPRYNKVQGCGSHGT